MRIRRSRLRYVGSPENQEASVVPVSRFRDIRLLAPGHWTRRGQVAVPVVEGQADTAEQAQVPGSGGVADHGHGGNGRESEHPVRPVFPGGVGVCGSDDLGCLVPACTNEAALAPDLHIRTAQGRILLDAGPRLHGAEGLPERAPCAHQPASDQWVLDPVC